MATPRQQTNATPTAVSDVPPMYLDGFGHWLAGFADGEGCFLVQRTHARHEHFFYLPRFTMALREDDRAILDEIAERTGLGTVRHYPTKERRVSEKAEIQFAMLREGAGAVVTDFCALAEEIGDQGQEGSIADRIWDLAHDLETWEAKAVQTVSSPQTKEAE